MIVSSLRLAEIIIPGEEYLVKSSHCQRFPCLALTHSKVNELLYHLTWIFLCITVSRVCCAEIRSSKHEHLFFLLHMIIVLRLVFTQLKDNELLYSQTWTYLCITVSCPCRVKMIHSRLLFFFFFFFIWSLCCVWPFHISRLMNSCNIRREPIFALQFPAQVELTWYTPDLFFTSYDHCIPFSLHTVQGWWALALSAVNRFSHHGFLPKSS